MAHRIRDEDARAMRRLWFVFMDEAAPIRPKLHAYCRRLTGSVFDAEDLVHETLIRAFGAIGQGDLSAGQSPRQNLAAYLGRIATNLWIDAQRRARRSAPAPPQGSGGEPAVVTRAAGAALFQRASPQERAAVVLKDVFDFALEDIATILATTPGAVKAALHRGRGKLEQASDSRLPPRGEPASPELIDRFIAAFAARDVAAVTAVLLEDVAWEARSVGGERGRDAIWISAGLERPKDFEASRIRMDEEEVVAGVMQIGGQPTLVSIMRLEEADGRVSRVVGYTFCPEVLAEAAALLGVAAAPIGYHQDAETLERMIAGSVTPWRGAI
jgi:RNA polymerase sigma-70 factor (ECF subfamily)